MNSNFLYTLILPFLHISVDSNYSLFGAMLAAFLVGYGKPFELSRVKPRLTTCNKYLDYCVIGKNTIKSFLLKNDPSINVKIVCLYNEKRPFIIILSF